MIEKKSKMSTLAFSKLKKSKKVSYKNSKIKSFPKETIHFLKNSKT